MVRPNRPKKHMPRRTRQKTIVMAPTLPAKSFPPYYIARKYASQKSIKWNGSQNVLYTFMFLYFFRRWWKTVPYNIMARLRPFHKVYATPYIWDAGKPFPEPCQMTIWDGKRAFWDGFLPCLKLFFLVVIYVPHCLCDNN